MKAIREPDPPEIRPTARVSQYANSRQRLSVQSLLLQSDFVDDSDQIAVNVSGGASQSARSAIRGGEAPVSSSGADVPNSDDRMSLDGAEDDTTALRDLEGFEQAGDQLNPWMGFPGADDIYGIPGLSGDLDAEY